MITVFLDRIKAFLEMQAFGVCAWWAEALGISSRRVRFFFIYTSFLTFFSPVLIYLSMAFVLNLHRYIKRKRIPVWEL